jgi:type IX secretion system PorP/SprF family membrane protein
MKYIAILFFGLGLQAIAQDPVFTNKQQSLVALNPSFAGSNSGLRYQSSTRSQWFNTSNSYLTFYNSIDAFVKAIKGAIALAYTRDDQAQGTLITDRIDLTYAQHFSLLDDKLKIIPSLQASAFRKTLDNTKLHYGDQIDARRGFAWSSFPLPEKQYKSNVDLSAGLVVNYNHFYFGSSIYHFTQPDEGLQGPSKLPYRSSSFISYNFSIGEKILLNALVRFENQQTFSNTYFNLNALFLKHMIFGSGITSNGVVNVLGGYRHHYFSISGGYEFGTSRINSTTAGSYEIAASFNLRNKENRKLVKDFERW